MTDAGIAVTEAEVNIVVTRSAESIDPTKITRASPKKIIVAALGAGFEMQAFESETMERGAQFKSGDRAGEFRPDKQLVHLAIIGSIPKAAAFLVRFKNYSFDTAKVWDAAGWPTELWFGYERSTPRRSKDEPEWAWAERVQRERAAFQRHDAEYNDGTVYVNKRPRFVNTATEFDEWLADLVPDYKPRARKEKEAPATAEVLIETGEWHG